MASLVQSVKYCAINTIGASKIEYYVIKFVSEAYTLQVETTWNIQIILSGELVFKAQYLIFIQEKINWYWDHKKQQQVIIFPKLTIVHTCLDVGVVKDIRDIPKNICNRNNKKQDLRKHPICLTESDHDYILEEIEHREKKMNWK